MPICPNCGAQQPEGATFCDECGAALRRPAVSYPAPSSAGQGRTVVGSSMHAGPRLCPVCGARNASQDPFCTNCGASLSEEPTPVQRGLRPMDGATVVAPAGAGARPEGLGSAPGAASVQGGLVCGQCGALLEPDSAFCDMCGAPVSRVSPPSGDETAVSYPPASDQAPVYEETVASQERGWQASGGGALQAPTPRDDALRAKPQGALVVRESNVTLDLVSGTPVWVIGREDPLSGIFPDIDLTDHGGDEGGVSRKHARIQVQGQRFHVEDLNSTNHTYLNRELLTPGYTYPLRDGDELCFGRVKVIFRSS